MTGRTYSETPLGNDNFLGRYEILVVGMIDVERRQRHNRSYPEHTLHMIDQLLGYGRLGIGRLIAIADDTGYTDATPGPWPAQPVR